MKLYKVLFLLMIAVSSFTASAQEIPKWKISQLETFIKETDKPTIVNFWATFCKPCLEELPYFQKMAKEYESQGVQLLLVNLDAENVYPKLKAFTSKYKITAPVVFLNETNADIFCPKVDEKWSGAIPATLFINNKTGYRKFNEDQVPENKMEEEIKALIATK